MAPGMPVCTRPGAIALPSNDNRMPRGPSRRRLFFLFAAILCLLMGGLLVYGLLPGPPGKGSVAAAWALVIGVEIALLVAGLAWIHRLMRSRRRSVR